MGKKSSAAITNLLNEVDATEDEKVFLDYAKATAAQDSNYTLIISLLLLTKQLARNATTAEGTYSQLALSTKRNAKILTALTAALAFLGLVQLIAMLIPFMN